MRADSGVHNVFYRPSSEALGGKEAISLFVNSQDGKAAAYEFALTPVAEGSAEDSGDDTVFECDYVVARCDFMAQAQGGARAIGKGVFVVMGGMEGVMEIADSSNNTQKHAYSLGGTPSLYDPFTFVYGK